MVLIFLFSLDLNSKDKRVYESVFDEKGVLQERLVLVDGEEYILFKPEKAQLLSQEINECRFSIPNLEKRLKNQEEISFKWEKIAIERLEYLEEQRKDVKMCYSILSQSNIEKKQAFYESQFFSYFLGNLTCVGGFYLWENARKN
jgi:hypothetical protein